MPGVSYVGERNEIGAMPSMRTFVCTLIAVAMAWLTPLALAVSCTTQSQMTESDRNALAESAKSLAALIQSGDSAGLKAKTIPSVAERFEAIGAAVDSAFPLVERATLTVQSLYLLGSSDLKTVEDETQFFCGGANAHEVVFTIPNLPPGNYARLQILATAVNGAQTSTDSTATPASSRIHGASI